MTSVRLLPVLLLVATLVFTLRVGEVVSGFRDLSGAANAEDQKPAADAPKKPGIQLDTTPIEDDQAAADHGDAPDKKEPDKKDAAASGDTGSSKDDKKSDPDHKDDKKADPANRKGAAWPDPAEMDPDLAAVQNKLLKDLAARREQLDLREKDLMTRDAVIKAAAAELEQKYQELSALRTQLQGLLGDQSEAEIERLKSLVRIYEGMKPTDAARIFNTLDLNILMDVLTRMSERKSAPILAAMDGDRARTVTLMMAQQRKLPDLPDLTAPAAGTP